VFHESYADAAEVSAQHKYTVQKYTDLMETFRRRIWFSPCNVNVRFLPVLLYGYETWSLILRDGQRLRVFENRGPRSMFGPMRDKVTGEWRRLHNEELNDLYSSPNTIRVIKSRRMRRAGYVARMGERTDVYRILVGRREGRRPLGRPRRRWKDNIKMDLQGVGWGH
jgi:hypothetical protein